MRTAPRFTVAKFLTALLVLVVIVLASGCVGGHRGMEARLRSTTVDFLYPNKEPLTASSEIPAMTLPLDIGIAFVPPGRNRGETTFSAERQSGLLTAVAEHFKAQPFIRNIQIIPTAYLRPGGGFANLDQLRSMFGVDVIALVSYDQVQHTDERAYSFAYLTVIGMYLVNGEENDTSTMLDTSVFHIPSRRLLFRAPGTSQVKGGATLINVGRRLRDDSLAGLEAANTNMIANLSRELDRFKQRVKERPEEFNITHAPGYRGAGDLGGPFAVTIGFLLLAANRKRKSA